MKALAAVAVTYVELGLNRQFLLIAVCEVERYE